MWRSIEIRNFRSLEHVKATLAPFTVVVGPNSSGKSNFVDAFAFARDIATDASHAIQNRGGIASIRRWSPTRSLDITIDVRIGVRKDFANIYAGHVFTLASKKDGIWSFKREEIRICRNKESIVLRQRPGTGRMHAGLELDETVSAMLTTPQWTPGSHVPTLPDLRSVHRFRLEPEGMRRPQVATERTRLDESGSNLAIAVQSLRAQPAKWAIVLDAMRKIIPSLTRIEDAVVGRYMSLRFFQARPAGNEAEFTATEMSEGAIRALGILVAAQQMQPRELLILEEPEVAIHPGAAGVLFDALKAASRHSNVLITTHSPELLDAASDEEILVCDYRKGVTEVGPLDKRQRKLVRDGLFSISEIMRAEPLRIDGKRPPLVGED